MKKITSQKTVRDLFTLIQFLREQIKASELTPSLSIVQIQALSYIYHTKNPLMREVAAFLGMTPPSATSLVNELIKPALVARATDPHDRRIVRLKITPLGNQLLAKQLQIVTRSLSKKMKALTNTEQATFARLLDSIISS